MFFTIIIFIIILGILVFVHEFGHFIVAKKSGMRVEEFGFGFPPRLFGLKKINGRLRMIIGHRKLSDSILGEQAGQAAAESTIYSINAIPLGGFVKILGENNEHGENPSSFINRPFWARFLTLIAGVVMNALLAWVLISIGFTIGMPMALDNASSLPSYAKIKNSRVAIMEVLPDSPAQKAGIMPNDVIIKIDNKDFAALEEVSKYIKENAGRKLEFFVKRSEKEIRIPVNSISNYGANEGPTGIALAVVGNVSFPFHRAILEGGYTTLDQIKKITAGIYQLIVSGNGFKSLGGPVKIVQITGEAANMGNIYLLQLTSFLSLNLAILNILPFPALDGGRVLMLLIEKARRKKNNQKVEQWINTIGFIFLVGLMILVTIKDVRGLF